MLRLIHRRCFSIESLAVRVMAEDFRRWGHRQADLDPLRLREKATIHELQPNQYSSLLKNGQSLNTRDIIHMPKAQASGEEIYNHLKASYCGELSIEMSHVSNSQERAWLAHRMESRITQTSTSEKQNAATKMLMAETFEHFLAKKFSSFKRYSGEGAEAMMPAVDLLLKLSAESSIDDAVIGMGHRGRLAMMVSLLEYPAHKIFWKILGNSEFPQDMHGVDDVTSHIAVSVDKVYGQGKVHVSLLHNPSHLEIINPVANGKTRAKRDAGSDAICIQLHGDAAFSGQGCVPEGLALSQLPDYETDGTIHIVVNNQIGFTTTYEHGRSSHYCTDIAKGIEAPILHVNAESMDNVLQACRIAFDYRSEFGKDILIDLVGYRRHGHNEVDEPSFTQPKMYSLIRNADTFPQKYIKSLIQDDVLSDKRVAKLKSQFETHMVNEFEKVQTYKVTSADAFGGHWKGMSQPTPEQLHERIITGVDTNLLIDVARKSVELPPEAEIHQRLRRTHVNARLKQLEADDVKVDWATAEAMAFGSLLLEGQNVRLAGQDCKRGTFSQRHAALTDQNTEKRYTPLANLGETSGRFDVINSNLSELAVMAFEYGYGWENPNSLVIWEAQFGDFNNGAQIVIDQFLASGESKWMRQNGLVLLLPHGYDGAGPDHSSGKMERFLQLVDSPALGPSIGTDVAEYMADINMSVVNLTTPANYFHALRRQQLRSYRKPLIIMSPKTLLRAADARSPVMDMGPGTAFKPVIGDNAAEADSTQRVIFCSGKVYYDLAKERAAKNNTITAIVRLEEVAPFPFIEIKEQLKLYPSATEYIWVQEEPLNQGAWSFIKPHFEKCFEKNQTLDFIGRPALPASAMGLSKYSVEQQKNLLDLAFP